MTFINEYEKYLVPLASEMTDIRIIDDLSVCGRELESLISALPQWRREAALRHRKEQGRRECCLSYLLLQDMLRDDFGIRQQPEFAVGEHGKPSLSCGIAFNISHCRRAIACVVSDEEDVGIDIECNGRYTESLADHCMSAEEKSAIAGAADPDMEFTLLWTRKEALLKLTGEGITDDLRTVLQSDRMRGVQITSHANTEKGYAWSIATKKKER